MAEASHSPLLALPPELRICIYSYALSTEPDDESKLPWIYYGTPHGPRVPGLLYTCRSMHEDAFSVYLRETTFAIELSTGHGIPWLRSLTTEQRNLLSKVVAKRWDMFATANQAYTVMRRCEAELAKAGIQLPRGVLHLEISLDGSVADCFRGREIHLQANELNVHAEFDKRIASAQVAEAEAKFAAATAPM